VVLKSEIMKINIGKKYRVFYGHENPNNKTVHILAIVDKDQIVIKWWSYTKKRWIYKVEHYYYFKTRFDGNFIKEVKR